jgi:hypothetical protein
MRNIKRIAGLLLFFMLMISLTQCQKNQLGGKSKVNGIVNHHGKPISGATVYIKFKATEFPGEDVSVYDASVTANQSGYYEINNFYKGEYYLYAVGIDPDVAAPGIVKGGIPVKLVSREEKNLDIPVSED